MYILGVDSTITPATICFVVSVHQQCRLMLIVSNLMQSVIAFFLYILFLSSEFSMVTTIIYYAIMQSIEQIVRH